MHSLAALTLWQALPGAASAARGLNRVQVPVGDEVPEEVRQYFIAAVDMIKEQLGDDFEARLTVYGVTAVLPSGIPGDPAKDYSSSGRRGDGHCGAYSPPDAGVAPYAICPAPGALPPGAAVAECCRHLAYAILPGRFALAVEDRVNTIIVSPRLWAFAEAQWQGVLAHELGHAVDFFLFGGRYRGKDHPDAVRATASALRARLEAIDKEEPDPELRADALGELLVLAPRAQQLCYSPTFLVQEVVGGSEGCGGEGGGAEMMRHFTHPPLQGGVKV